MPMDLTDAARDGWDRVGSPNPHMRSSPNFDAWEVGAHLRRNSAPKPDKAAGSRGNSVRINGTHVFKLIYGNGHVAVEAA